MAPERSTRLAATENFHNPPLEFQRDNTGGINLQRLLDTFQCVVESPRSELGVGSLHETQNFRLLGVARLRRWRNHRFRFSITIVRFYITVGGRLNRWLTRRERFDGLGFRL